jgi:phosphatidylethanolamine/phosphatidyl-N-methylethanolamine N-methyltransferase
VRLVGIDLSQEMLDKAVERVQHLAMPNVTLKVMDATAMDFGDNEFDKAVATYTISAVPDPVAVLREMRRVVKPGGLIVLLNHFRSERRGVGRFEDLVAPVCTRLGWKSNLPLAPLLQQVGLDPELVMRVNLFNGWRLVKCVNRK